jgi:uracil-DNA glycosylase
MRWIEQGCFMLNSVLTVREGASNSHKGRGWENFTNAIISVLNERKENLVFMLWGNAAQNKCARVDNTRHYVLKAVHPSPLSARKGFFGCGHFSQCNAILEELGLPEIDWQI